LPIEGKYSIYPFMDQLTYGNVCIFELTETNSEMKGHKHNPYLTHFDKDNLTFCSPIKCERENTGRCFLKGGKSYVIVCSTELAKKRGRFFLSVYFNQACRDVDLKRVFHPKDLNSSKD